jgi:hypothetical protein
MDWSITIWISALSMFAVAVVLTCYMIRKGKPRNYMIKGLSGVVGGILLFISLFFPWVKIVEYGVQISGLDIGDLFVFLIKMQIMQAITMFLLLFSFLVILGGFLLIVGYDLGMEIVKYASGLALFTSVIIVLVLGTIPSTQLYVALEMSPGLYIFGSIVGLVSTRLEKQ